MLIMFSFLLIGMLFGPLTTHSIWLLGIDVTNILLAYLSFYLLGARTMEPTELGGYAYLFSIPVYWVLISIAAWRALWQLVHVPHLWEKTPHQPSLFYISTDDGVRNVEPRPMID